MAAAALLDQIILWETVEGYGVRLDDSPCVMGGRLLKPWLRPSRGFLRGKTEWFEGALRENYRYDEERACEQSRNYCNVWHGYQT